VGALFVGYPLLIGGECVMWGGRAMPTGGGGMAP
jgi:hypothetical protein